mgnify:FL=1
MRTQESGEDYLETILTLQKRQGYVRSIDIANELEYTKPSISRAMKILRENDLIAMDDNKMITLTELGKQKANEIYERHKTIARFLSDVLGVSEDVAENDACRIEHVISEETMDKMSMLLEEHQEQTV